VKILCAADDQWHELTPTAMAIIIEAFQDGDLQHIYRPTGGGLSVENLCILEGLTDERLEKFRTRYPGNTVKAE
jgi:hypothetical protein